MFFLRILFLSVLAFAQLDARESHAPFIFLGSSVYTRFGKSSIPRLRDPASWLHLAAGAKFTQPWD